MMISTRGRYALRVLADLAEHRSEGFVPMKDVAARQEISLKYMEKILPVLTKNHIVDGIQGKGAVLVEGYEGDYNNIVGLPVDKLLENFPDLLRREVPVEITQKEA